MSRIITGDGNRKPIKKFVTGDYYWRGQLTTERFTFLSRSIPVGPSVPISLVPTATN